LDEREESGSRNKMYIRTKTYFHGTPSRICWPVSKVLRKEILHCIVRKTVISLRKFFWQF